MSRTGIVDRAKRLGRSGQQWFKRTCRDKQWFNNIVTAVGRFIEVKASRLGRNVAMGHFSYVGDAEIGANVNIGAGTVTCNFDGVDKNQTIVEEGAFIGSDTMLVAPVRVGARAVTGAGSVVIRDVPPGAKVAGVPAQQLRAKEGQHS